MSESETYAIEIRTRNPDAILAWVLENIPSAHYPDLTRLSDHNFKPDDPSNEFTFRATFKDKKYAALYRLFLDEGA